MKNKIKWTTIDIDDEATWPDGAFKGGYNGFRRAICLTNNDCVVSKNESGIILCHENGELLLHGEKWAVIE